MYQFIHIEAYAENVSTKALSRRTIKNENGKQKTGTKSLLNVRQVIAEAKRENGAYPHVLTPQKPITIYGVDLDEVERLAVSSKAGQSDSMSRKLRNDTPILLAGIASYPSAEYEANLDDFKAWLNDSVNWLQKIYGDNLKNVTLHLDEEHPHIHFYAISPTGRVKHIHHGYQAEALISDKSDSKIKKLAFVSAMQEFQDQYYLEVASKHGMVRLGPKKLRKSRSEYQADKSNAKLLSRKISEIDLIEKAALINANDISDSKLKDVKLQIEKMLFHARQNIQRMQDDALRWTKNAIENMRKLNEAEAKVIELDAKLKTTSEELQYFVQENRELERRLSNNNSKIT